MTVRYLQLTVYYARNLFVILLSVVQQYLFFGGNMAFWLRHRTLPYYCIHL